MKRTMAGEVLSINREFPMARPDAEEIRPAWYIRAGIYAGVLMSVPPPKVWTWNPSVITLLLMIAGILAGGGYYIGHQAAVIENIQKQADKASSDAATVQNLIGQQGEPSPSPTPTRRR